MKEKYRKFMQGRYGADQLYNCQFVMLIILFCVDLFVDNVILWIVEAFLIIWMFYRVFSKNIYKRCRENERFLEIKDMLRQPFINIERNIKDRKHIYKRCLCGTTLKVKAPKKMGIKHAKCPNCHKRVRLMAFKTSK